MSKILGVITTLILQFTGAIFDLFSWIPRPSSGPTDPDTPAQLSGKLASVIYNYNVGHSWFIAADSWTIPAKGVAIHKITIAQANAIADAAQKAVNATGYPLTFLLACLGVESVLDPNCQNGNLGPGESNAGRPDNLAGYDMGIGQFKLGMLAESLNLSLTDANAFAIDPARAIGYHVQVMLGNVTWAKGIIAADTSSATDPRCKNAYLAATCAYNYGRTGFLSEFYVRGTFPDGEDGRPSHGVAVIHDEAYFAKALGVNPIFASLS